jgi:hypothetical protein
MPPPPVNRPYWGEPQYDHSFRQPQRSNNNSFYNNDRSSGGGGRSGGSSRFFGKRTNALGLHGDMQPNPRIEDELFNSADSQTTGINFDKVNYIY